MDLRLPPLPLSPIPRKMTRNPFERYLLAHSPPDINARADHSGSAALHARLVRAITQNVDATPPVLVAIEARLAGSGASDVDEEMASVEKQRKATQLCRSQHHLVEQSHPDSLLQWNSCTAPCQCRASYRVSGGYVRRPKKNGA